MHRTAKKPKIFSVPFQNFWEKGQKGTKRDMKVFIIYQFFGYVMSLFVPFCPFLSLFQPIFIIFLPFLVFLRPFCPFLSPFVPFCPFLSCPFLPFTGEGGQKGTWDPPFILKLQGLILFVYIIKSRKPKFQILTLLLI